MLGLRRLVLLWLFLIPVCAWAKPVVTDARIGADGGLTRIELQVSQAPHFHVIYVPDPDRIVIDLDELDWRVGAGHKLQGT
jgi:N-acetylmuramoyl-L-alanine amidase